MWWKMRGRQGQGLCSMLSRVLLLSYSTDPSLPSSVGPLPSLQNLADGFPALEKVHLTEEQLADTSEMRATICPYPFLAICRSLGILLKEGSGEDTWRTSVTKTMA